MESHVLNCYHSSRYSSTQLLRQTGPQYRRNRGKWHQEHWTRNQTINVTRNLDTSSDEDETVEVDVQGIADEPAANDTAGSVDGDDYDEIQVYAVDPDLDLEEASDDDNYDETKDFCINETIEADSANTHDENTYTQNLDTNSNPISNDDYFKDYKDILAVKDEPVVNDVDEYFIKEKPKVTKPESFLIKNTGVNVEDNVGKHTVIQENGVQEPILDGSINEELEILPNIDDLRKFLLEDNTYTKFKSAQRSCSLPQSPMHNIFLDIDDAKTCLSFEDLDLDLSDIAFDSVKARSRNSSKSDDAPRILTEEDVNSFLITDNKVDKSTEFLYKTAESVDKTSESVSKAAESLHKTAESVDKTSESHHKTEGLVDEIVEAISDSVKPASATVKIEVINDKLDQKFIENVIPEDDLSQQDMEIEHPVEPSVPVIPPISTKAETHQILLVSPMKIKPIKTEVKKVEEPEPNVLKFCIEKNPVKKVKADPEDIVDVVSCTDTVIPVLEANNLSSLLEQFEASEKLNVKPKKIVPVDAKVKAASLNLVDAKVKAASLKNGMRLQDAGVQLNKTKMRQILMPSIPVKASIRTPSPVHSDHDYCSTKKRYSLPNIKSGQSLLKPEVLSSNNRILNSRHRSCKNKVIYNLNSDTSDEEKVVNDIKMVTRNQCDVNLKIPKDFDVKIPGNVIVKIPAAKATVNKVIHQPTRKKPSQVNLGDFNKSNNTVMNKSAFKASDTLRSQSSNSSIKLVIRNKSEVIINCDNKDSQNYKSKDKCNVIKSVYAKAMVSKNKEIKKEKDCENIKIKALIVNTKKDINEYVNRPALIENIKKEDESGKTIVVNKNVKNSNNKNSNNKTVNRTVETIQSDIDRKEVKTLNSVGKTDHYINVKVKIEPTETTEDFYTGLFENKHDVQVPLAMQPKAEKRSLKDELRIEATQNIEIEPPAKKKKLNLQEYKMRRGVNSNNSSATVSPEPIFPEMPILHKNVTKPIPIDRPNVLITDRILQEAPKKYFDPIKEASRKILMNSNKLKAEARRRKEDDLLMKKIPKVENLELQPLISDADMLKMVNITNGVTVEQVKSEVKEEKPEKPRISHEYEEIILVSIGVNTDDKVFKELDEHLRKSNPKSPTDKKTPINFKIKKSEIIKENVFEKKRDRQSPEGAKSDKMDKDRFKDITATLKSVQKQVDAKMSSNSLFASIKDVVKKKAPENNNKSDTKPDERAKSDSPKRMKPVKTTIVRDFNVHTDHGEDKVILHLAKDRNKPQSSSIITQTDFEPISKQSPKDDDRSRRRNDSDISISSNVSIRKDHSKSQKDCRRANSEKRSIDRYKRSRSPHFRRSDSGRSKSRDRYRRYRRSDSPHRRRRRSYSRRRRSPSTRREYRSKRSRCNKSTSRNTRSKTPLAKKSPQKVGPEKKAEKSMTPSPRKRTISDSSTSSSSSSSTSSSSSSSSASGDSKGPRSPAYSREPRSQYRSFSSEDREPDTPVEERRIVFVGRLEKDVTKAGLRAQFIKFGLVTEVRLHSKEDGSRYGFVTFERARDAFAAVGSAKTFPHYDVGFGGRRAFCRRSYADLDGIEANYTENSFHAPVVAPRRDDMSFEQMLQDMKWTLSQRKGDHKDNDG